MQMMRAEIFVLSKNCMCQNARVAVLQNHACYSRLNSNAQTCFKKLNRRNQSEKLKWPIAGQHFAEYTGHWTHVCVFTIDNGVKNCEELGDEIARKRSANPCEVP
jgi:hypothetical protein